MRLARERPAKVDVIRVDAKVKTSRDEIQSATPPGALWCPREVPDMAKMVTVTVPEWVLGVAFAAVLWGGVWLATVTPEPYKPWAVLLAVLWPWWPFAATGIRNWRRRRDDRRRWKAGAALREQAAQQAEYNETNGLTRP